VILLIQIVSRTGPNLNLAFGTTPGLDGTTEQFTAKG